MYRISIKAKNGSKKVKEEFLEKTAGSKQECETIAAAYMNYLYKIFTQNNGMCLVKRIVEQEKENEIIYDICPVINLFTTPRFTFTIYEI